MTLNTEKKGNGIRPSLVIIDVQNRYMPFIPPRDKEMGVHFINMLIELFRGKDLPIVRIYHRDAENGSVEGTEQFEYDASVQIKSEDTQIIKIYSDSFNKTNLDEVLKERGINTLFLCGQSAVGCVMATRTGAFNHDYKPFIVKDAIMCHNSNYTRNIEAMFNAVSFDIVKLIVENC